MSCHWLPANSKLTRLIIMENMEIEIQARVEDIKPLKDFLEASADFLGEKRQIDEYYTPAHRDFASMRPIKEWLRLRDAAGKYSVTYKNWHHGKDGQSLDYCDEYETELKDGESFRKILQAMDFKFLTVVDKIRKIWVYQNYEIALDSVLNLGDFVEIEYKDKEDNLEPEKILKDSVFFLKSFGCGKLERNNGGYPFLLMFPEEAKYEEIK